MRADGGTDARVLLAVRGAARSDAPIDLALQLAVALEAELAGVFIEDSDLLRVAALPFTREVGRVTGALRPLDPGEVEASLRRQAEQVRHALADLTRSSQVKWSFRVARGTLPGAVLSSARRADIVVAGERRPPVRRTAGEGVQTVTVVFEPDRSGVRTLTTALNLAGGRVERLAILVPDAAAADLEALRRQAAQAVQAAPELLRVATLPSREAAGLVRSVRQQSARALVLAPDSLHDGERQVRVLLEELPCPLVLVF